MTMTTSAKGKLEIISHEAIVVCPYLDSVGVWTWGIGHTSGAGEPHPADMPKGVASPIPDVLAAFSKDLAKYEDRVRRAFTRPLTQAQFDAAVSFDFNTGAIDRASWVRAFNAGSNRLTVSGDFMIWRTPGSIIDRRKAECALFFDGKYSNYGTASVYTADAAGHVLWSKGKRVNVAALLSAPQPAPQVQPTPARAVPQTAAPAPASSVPPSSPVLQKQHTAVPLAAAGLGAAVAYYWQHLHDLALSIIHHVERFLP